jgi:hypothetical protein
MSVDLTQEIARIRELADLSRDAAQAAESHGDPALVIQLAWQSTLLDMFAVLLERLAQLEAKLEELR